mgnify:CR=1 FL=1|jgi:hypothetical protein
MKYKALVSFAGAVTMAKGEVKEIDNPLIAKDLLSAKYIEPVEEKKKKNPVKGV